MTETTSQPLVISVTEAAVLLGVSRATAYECVRTKELPSIRLGGRILIPRQRLLDMIDGNGGNDGRVA